MARSSSKVGFGLCALYLGVAAFVCGLMFVWPVGQYQAVYYADMGGRYSADTQQTIQNDTERAEQYRKALAAMETALRYDPHNSFLWVRFAHLLRLGHDPDDLMIAQALDIAALLAPHLKADIQKHRAFLLPPSSLPERRQD